MSQFRCSLFALVLFCWNVGVGTSSTLYNNGAPNQADGSDISGFISADDFTISALNGNVTSAVFWSSTNVDPYPGQFSGTIGWTGPVATVNADLTGSGGRFDKGLVSGNDVDLAFEVIVENITSVTPGPLSAALLPVALLTALAFYLSPWKRAGYHSIKAFRCISGKSLGEFWPCTNATNLIDPASGLISQGDLSRIKMKCSHLPFELSIIIAFFAASPAFAAAGASPITASGSRGMVLGAAGQVCAAGDNAFGVLGNGNFVNQLSPVPAALPAGIKTVSTGGNHSLAADSTGTVWAWGDNDYGELGDGTTVSKATPNPVPGLANVIEVAAGGGYSLALKSDGTVWGWGYNVGGELGNGTTTYMYNTPIQVSQVANVVAIAAGADFSLALESNGTVWAWGAGTFGQIGNGATSTVFSPVQVINLDNVTAIAAGASHALALKSDGTVWTWGFNSTGQLGDGTAYNSSTPVAVSALSGISAIGAGDAHSLAVASNGAVYAWGDNDQGQLGNGTDTLSWTPVQVSGVIGGVAIAGGSGFSEVLTSDGIVYAWGVNTYGQLGNGTTNGSSTPVAALPCASAATQGPPASGVASKLAAAEGSSISVQSSGTIWAWGNNANGQLGDGTTVNRLSPVQATGPTGVTQVAEGWSHSLALQSDGTVWAWGDNFFGEIGDGTQTNRLSPLQVPGLTHFIGAAAGNSFSLALKSDGTVWAWGLNTAGQLGTGTTAGFSATPMQVQQVANVVAIAAGGDFSLALEGNGSVWAWGDPEVAGNGAFAANGNPGPPALSR